MSIPREIFREYDIRGLAESHLLDPAPYELGRAIGTFLRREGSHRVVLGEDCRLSSPRITGGISKGLLESGLDVVHLGAVATPLMYFSLHHFKDVDGGVMVTASHNPGDYNGVKIASGKSTIYGRQIQKIWELSRTQDFEEGVGCEQEREILPAYEKMVQQRVGRLDKRLRVVVDAGNGMAGQLAPNIYRGLGCQVFELYCELDGSFPNHHPDPTVTENLQELIQEVEFRRADLGIAFDGDGDRIGVIDEKGNIIWGDELMVLFSRDVLSRTPGATVIGEVKCSMNLYNDIEANGGKGLMWKTGHSLIKAKMKETGAALAGEMSGHIFFAEGYFGFDDATFAGARLLKILADSGKGIGEQLADLPELHSTPEIRMDIPEDCKLQIVEELQMFFSALYETVTIDGIRIVFDDGWALVRASNTEPALVLRFEAETSERLKEIRALVEMKLADVIRERVSDSK